jgi:hypothetical protein
MSKTLLEILGSVKVWELLVIFTIAHLLIGFFRAIIKDIKEGRFYKR